MGIAIKSIVAIRSGYHFRGKVESVSGGSRRVAQPRDIRDDLTWCDSGMATIAPEPVHENSLIVPGDVLIAARGVRPYAVVVPSGLGDALASSAFFIIRPQPALVCPEFLAWYLNSPRGQHALTSLMRGTAIPALTLATLSTLEIPVPSLERQRAVVAAAELIEDEARLCAAIAEDRRLALSLSL